jgi:hypothetical protein
LGTIAVGWAIYELLAYFGQPSLGFLCTLFFTGLVVTIFFNSEDRYSNWLKIYVAFMVSGFVLIIVLYRDYLYFFDPHGYNAWRGWGIVFLVAMWATAELFKRVAECFGRDQGRD